MCRSKSYLTSAFNSYLKMCRENPSGGRHSQVSAKDVWYQIKTSPTFCFRHLAFMGTISDAKDIADGVVYLTEARHVTGEVLHVDAGSHQGKW